MEAPERDAGGAAIKGDEYRIKPVEEVKYMKNGEEEEQKIVQKNQENLEKSAAHPVKSRNNTEAPAPGNQHRINIHISESQQEFFRMLDEKIEKVNLHKQNYLILNSGILILRGKWCSAKYATVYHM
ncbi:unnamed protein product [Ranitomeya imitator]|uniref:Uncharacterized protein n=1 Tax=Ranitomeya imitator TaxID=111125 RepID=A0ABN9LDX9_9NEOB|nr:unnamed protein product [Ranitomeya imitator]